jgi:ATP-dependent 26S proteasome regulatory subunit
LGDHDTPHAQALNRWLEQTQGALFLAAETRRNLTRPTIMLNVKKPTASEQRALWLTMLDERAVLLDGALDRLVSQFDLDADSISAVHSITLAAQADNLEQALWDGCRVQARPRLDDLAQRIEASATWDDIVLPEAQLRVLREIAMHVRRRQRVYETWGWNKKQSRGLGISALFAGASGTGKTMAGEVLANELQLDLYRIDLSAVVSKYIGETERNLKRVFDAAEAGGAILLFDEADALFGKRTEVQDSHDRYANIEISYLLQRMEQYRGLAILTTNLLEALDKAFLRRIRFVVNFPFPDFALRQEIWRRVFPHELPQKAVDPSRLARLNIAGGNIRNIALNASFLAADAAEPVQMHHLLRAAQSEYDKLDRKLTDSEIRDWVLTGRR